MRELPPYPSEPPRRGSLVPVVTPEDVVELMRAGVAEAGSNRAYARAFALHEGDLGQVLRGRRLPTERMAMFVGIERQLVRDGPSISPLWTLPSDAALEDRIQELAARIRELRAQEGAPCS